jgi:hypothetical protein
MLDQTTIHSTCGHTLSRHDASVGHRRKAGRHSQAPHAPEDAS